MGQIPGWASTVIAIGGFLGTLVTAVATFFLWRVTRVLAVETKRMALAASQPHVVATLEPNRWSLGHFDINVNNSGNAPAYDITVEFTPPLQNVEARSSEGGEVPFGNISVLRPGQGVASYLSDYEGVKDAVYNVRVSWRRSASDPVREENAYTLNMADKRGVSELGGDPIVQIAKHLSKLEAEWRPVARGAKRVKVDGFTSGDRLHERRVAERLRRRRQQEQRPVPPTNVPPAGH